jgi:hypothetical protein
VGFSGLSSCMQYHGLVEDFHLGHHSLATSRLQSVIDQCIAYDKDTWKGPVGWDGNPHAYPWLMWWGASGGDGSNPYDAMCSVSFNKHQTQWHFTCKDRSEECLMFGLPQHFEGQSTRCKRLPDPEKARIENCQQRTPADGDTTSLVDHDGQPPTQPPAPSPAPEPLAAENGGSGTAPGAFTVTTKPESSYNSAGKEFEYKGKHEGRIYNPSYNPNANYLYLTNSHPSCAHVSFDKTPLPTARCNHSVESNHCSPPINPNLPIHVLALLQNPPANFILVFSNKCCPKTSLLVAYTGATDHMLPDKVAFISYSPVQNHRV